MRKGYRKGRGVGVVERAWCPLMSRSGWLQEIRQEKEGRGQVGLRKTNAQP